MYKLSGLLCEATSAAVNTFAMVGNGYRREETMKVRALKIGLDCKEEKYGEKKKEQKANMNSRQETVFNNPVGKCQSHAPTSQNQCGACLLIQLISH